MQNQHRLKKHNPPMTKDDDYCEVEKILGKALIDGVEHYQVKWQGYEETSWEPVTNLTSVEWMITEFNTLVTRKSSIAGQSQSQPRTSSQTKSQEQPAVATQYQGQATNVKQLLLRKRQEEQQNPEGQQIQDKAQIIRQKRLKKSRDEKFQGDTLPHDLQTNTEVIHNLMQNKRQKPNPEVVSAKAQQEAAFVAQNAHNLAYNKRVSTFSHQEKGVIVPQFLTPTGQEVPKQNFQLGQLPKHGSFETDQAMQISKAKFQSGRLFCTVQWDKRPNGFIPEETIYTNSEIKKYNPLLLCEFYERICKVKKKDQDTSDTIGSENNAVPRKISIK